MSTSWYQQITINGVTTTPHDFLREKYAALSDTEVAAIFRDAGVDIGANAVEHKRRREGWYKDHLRPRKRTHTPGGDPLSANASLLLDALREAKGEPVSVSALSSAIDRGVSSVLTAIDELVDAGYNVVRRDSESASLDNTPPSTHGDVREIAQSNEVRIAVMSDIHAGSSAQQVSAAHAFIRKMYGNGVRHIVIAGDLVAGVGVYRGQAADLCAHTGVGQLDAIDYTLLRMDGLKYYAIGGNHDYSFIKNMDGYNLLAVFASRRDDVYYLGYDVADVPLTDSVDIRLWHPSGGVPYAVSYRLQKGMEAMAFEELSNAIESGDNPKLRLVIAGHLHVAAFVPRGPVVGIQAGCFEGRTNYLKRKGLYPQIGGWELTIHVTDSGSIEDIAPVWTPYSEVQGDCVVARKEFRADKVEPMFVLKEED